MKLVEMAIESVNSGMRFALHVDCKVDKPPCRDYLTGAISQLLASDETAGSLPLLKHR
jgi:hypothetical protein